MLFYIRVFFYLLALIAWINNSYTKILPSDNLLWKTVKIMLKRDWLDNTFLWVPNFSCIQSHFGQCVNCIWNILLHRCSTSWMGLGIAVPRHNSVICSSFLAGDATAMYGRAREHNSLWCIFFCAAMLWKLKQQAYHISFHLAGLSLKQYG